jgi:hypothetical protein
MFQKVYFIVILQAKKESINVLYIRIVFIYIVLAHKQTLSKENPHRILSFGHNNPALKTTPIRGRLFKGGFNFTKWLFVLEHGTRFLHYVK